VKATNRHTSPKSADDHSRHQDPVYGITTAEEALSADIGRRQKQYLLTMGFRVVAILVVVCVPGIGWPLKIVLAVVATVIPFIAVVRANGSPEPDADPTNLLLAPPGPPAIEGRDFALGSAQEFYPGESVPSDPFGGEPGTASGPAAARP
jgi:Protein of unknown function (DUF3099)